MNMSSRIRFFPEHRRRMEHIYAQLHRENLLDGNDGMARFLNKWVFVLPWTIENCAQLLASASQLTDSEQEDIGFRLSRWTPP